MRARSGEPDQRLVLLHGNVRKCETALTMLAPGTELAGALIRAG